MNAPRVAADVRTEAVLRELYGLPKIGVEVGVFRGQMSRRLLQNDPALFLFMVDSWKASEEGDSYTSTDDYIARFTQEQHDAVMQEAIAAVSEFANRHKVLRMTSLDAAKEFKDGSLDFVFIDGNHTFDYAAPDIIYWSRKVRSGGLVMVHDCYSWSGAGVLQAVYAYTHCHNLFWFVTKENEPTAFWVKP